MLFGVIDAREEVAVLSGTSPWVDAAAVSVQGGAGGGRGVAVGAGLAFPIARERSIWLGPFVRDLQIVESSAGHGGRASDGLLAGVTLEVHPAAGPAR